MKPKLRYPKYFKIWKYIYVCMGVCFHIYTHIWILTSLSEFGGESDHHIYLVINFMTCLFPVRASPYSYPLGPGPHFGGVLENDCAQLRSIDGHFGVLKESP